MKRERWEGMKLSRSVLMATLFTLVPIATTIGCAEATDEESGSAEGAQKAAAEGGTKEGGDAEGGEGGASIPAGAVCAAGEDTVFSCITDKGKQVAVCASKTLSATAGYVQYRFGTKDKADLRIPSDVTKQTRSGMFGHVAQIAGGGEIKHLRFEAEKDAISYYVYQGNYNPTAHPEEAYDDSGVWIGEGQRMAPDARLGVYKCVGSPDNNISQELLEKAGIPDGGDLPFDLPAK